jgi:putative isomerase
MLTAADVGLNSLLVLDAEILSYWAEQRGDQATALRLRQRGSALAAKVRDHLWDDERKVFANRLWNGRFVRSIAPTSFYPLLAGIATPEQTQHLLRWLDDPRGFGGFWRLPSVTRDDPAYHDNVYWRGRSGLLNLLTYLGLRRADQSAAAERLASDSFRLFEQGLEQGQCPENFNAESGLADDQPDTDLFYGWGGLMPLIATLDISPDAVGRLWEIELKPRHMEPGAAARRWPRHQDRGRRRLDIAAPRWRRDRRNRYAGNLVAGSDRGGCLVLPVHRRRPCPHSGRLNRPDDRSQL